MENRKILFVGSLLLICLWFSRSIVFADDQVLANCACPPARCDECHSQNGIDFFTPVCKDGTKLSCARAACVEKDPLPLRCEEEKRRVASLKEVVKKAKEQIQTVKSNSYGTFAVATGDIKIQHSDNKVEPATLGKKVYTGDLIISGENSKARLLFVDNNVINILASSKLKIVEYEFDEKSEKKISILELREGQVRNTLHQKYEKPGQKFQVKTPTAVAGVRGTDFLVAYNPRLENTRLVTFHGEVAFGKPSTSLSGIQDSLPVRAGQASSLSSDMIKPMPVQVLTEFEMARFDTESQVLNSGEERSPSSEQSRAPASSQPSSTVHRKVAYVEATCLTPNAALYECTWVRVGKECQRRRCFADGHWRFETTERDPQFCFESEVKSCD